MKQVFTQRFGTIRCALKQIHPVDKSLLLFMLILLAQTIYSVFYPEGANQTVGDIDVIVRTSAAAIFGYFLSANFIRHFSSAGQVPSEQATHILKVGADSGEETGEPKAKIGFTVNETTIRPDDEVQRLAPPVCMSEPVTSVENKETVQQNAPSAAVLQGTSEGDKATSDQGAATGCVQVFIATAIGLFCLITLLVLRNLVQLGVFQVQANSMAETVIQFRDFISGCIGFLIGCPTYQDSST